MEKDLKNAILESYGECEICKKNDKKNNKKDKKNKEHKKDKKSDKPNKKYKIRKQFIMNELSFDRRFAQAVVVDYLDLGIRRIYVAGQTSPYPDEPNQGDFQAAIDKVIDDIDRYLKLGRGKLSNVVETHTIIQGDWTDEALEALINAKTRAFGSEGQFPTSTTILAGLVFPTLLVEMNATAEFQTPKKWKVKVKPSDGLIVEMKYE